MASGRERTGTLLALWDEAPAGAPEVRGAAGGDILETLDLAALLPRDRSVGSEEPTAAQAGQSLCAWNAFVLQTLAEQTPDRGPAMMLLSEAEQWAARARWAADHPGYRVEEELGLPAELPLWPLDAAGPIVELEALASGVRMIRACAEILAQAGPSAGRVGQLLARARAAAESAEDLLGAGGSELALRKGIEARLHLALEACHLGGQLAAMPALPDHRPYQSVRPEQPLELEKIDLWYLTDPRARDLWRADPRARRAAGALWVADADPSATIRIQAEIDAAMAAGLIGYARDASGDPLGHHFRCPWPAVYEARDKVLIGGALLRPLQHFTYTVHFGDGPDVRQIKVGTFTPAAEIDYGYSGT